MTKRATAADILLRAAEKVEQLRVISYYALVEDASVGASDDDCRIAQWAAEQFACSGMQFKDYRIRVLALLFARELVLSGDV